jgi:hypothetical protein
MKTPLHTRNKNRRNLFRAVPINNEAKLEKQEREEWDALAALVDQGHKHFWSKRTQGKPPHVSKTRLMAFDTLDPSKI